MIDQGQGIIRHFIAAPGDVTVGPHQNKRFLVDGSSLPVIDIGDLYLNFGVASVVVGMLVIGALLRLFQTRFLGPHPTMVGILAAIVVIVQFLIKQIGSAAAVMATTAFALAPVLIVYFAVAYLVRGKPPPAEPSWSEQDDVGAGARS